MTCGTEQDLTYLLWIFFLYVGNCKHGDGWWGLGRCALMLRRAANVLCDKSALEESMNFSSRCVHLCWVKAHLAFT